MAFVTVASRVLESKILSAEMMTGGNAWTFSQTMPVINIEEEEISRTAPNATTTKLWEVKNLFLDRCYKKCAARCEKLLSTVEALVRIQSGQIQVLILTN